VGFRHIVKVNGNPNARGAIHTKDLPEGQTITAIRDFVRVHDKFVFSDDKGRHEGDDIESRFFFGDEIFRSLV